jgi:hypothetical protein
VHTQEINEYPEDIKAEFLQVSEWIRATRKRHGAHILIHLVDPQSLGGMWKVLRHRIRRYPTFFVDGTERIVGWDGDPDAALARALARRGEGAYRPA